MGKEKCFQPGLSTELTAQNHKDIRTANYNAESRLKTDISHSPVSLASKAISPVGSSTEPTIRPLGAFTVTLNSLSTPTPVAH